MPLSTAEIEELEELLFSEELQDDALDYFGFHGLVCASTIGPEKIALDHIKAIVFSDITPKASPKQLEHFSYCVNTVQDEIQDALMQGSEARLPYEEEEDFEACIESWCIGFMEGFFHHETQWFAKDEEVSAELLLPIMALSGLFDSEEFQEICDNEKLMSQFESLITDQLTDIYLYYHSD